MASTATTMLRTSAATPRRDLGRAERLAFDRGLCDQNLVRCRDAVYVVQAGVCLSPDPLLTLPRSLCPYRYTITMPLFSKSSHPSTPPTPTTAARSALRAPARPHPAPRRCSSATGARPRTSSSGRSAREGGRTPGQEAGDGRPPGLPGAEGPLQGGAAPHGEGLVVVGRCAGRCRTSWARRRGGARWRGRRVGGEVGERQEKRTGREDGEDGEEERPRRAG